MNRQRPVTFSPAGAYGDMARRCANKRQPGSAQIEECARDVVREYLASRWGHLDGTEWTVARSFLLNELLERCPGHSTREYRVALDLSLVRRRSMLKLRLRRRHAVAVALASGLALIAGVGCESKAPTRSLPHSEAATAAAQSSIAVGEQRVEVSESGFQPARVNLGASRRIVFRRTTEGTCATAVVFPSLGIEKPLPLNADVIVDLPATLAGEVAFQCGMGMLKGMLVAR